MTRVAFLTCHLTGTGHLVRTLAIARATAAAGAEVQVLNGGRPLGHVDSGGIAVVQVPPVTVPDFDFATLRRPDGRPADAAYMAARRDALLAALEAFRPHALVTETFPLGRRMLAGEFEAAIAAVRAGNPGAAILASVRDIPEPKPRRVAETAARLERHYDALLVHGQEEVVPLSATWPLPAFAPRTRHTGYVAAPGPIPQGRPGDTVLVAVGGGVLGRRLLAVAADAARRSSRPWHLLTGGPDAAEQARALAGRGLRAEPPRADYRSLLARAAVSVSLAGYNTVTDLALTDTPALLVPFAEHGEREQAIRAAALARFPGITVLDAGQLTAEALAAAVEQAAGGQRRPPLPLRTDGAEVSAGAILDCIGARARA